MLPYAGRSARTASAAALQGRRGRCVVEIDLALELGGVMAAELGGVDDRGPGLNEEVPPGVCMGSAYNTDNPSF